MGYKKRNIDQEKNQIEPNLKIVFFDPLKSENGH